MSSVNNTKGTQVFMSSNRFFLTKVEFFSEDFKKKKVFNAKFRKNPSTGSRVDKRRQTADMTKLIGAFRDFHARPGISESNLLQAWSKFLTDLSYNTAATNILPLLLRCMFIQVKYSCKCL